AEVARPPQPPAAALDDPAGPPGDDPSVAPAGGGLSIGGKPAGIALGAVGLLLLAGGLLAMARRAHYVLLRGGEAFLKLRARNEMEQTQLLATLQAAREAAKATPAPIATPAPPPAPEVDDGGDPVKALQDLAAERAARKISDDDFH